MESFKREFGRDRVTGTALGSVPRSCSGRAEFDVGMGEFVVRGRFDGWEGAGWAGVSVGDGVLIGLVAAVSNELGRTSWSTREQTDYGERQVST